jgi:Mg/Co/Ni transporter MgtE
LATVAYLRLWQLQHEAGVHNRLFPDGNRTLGSLVGSMLPIFLKRLKLDPAASSAPFVATLVDVTGIIIYFSVAYFFLKGILL